MSFHDENYWFGPNDGSNGFNKASASMPRPAHVVPSSLLSKVQAGFPEKNVIDCGFGLQLKWKRPRWGRLDIEASEEFQMRKMLAAVFRDSELLCVIDITETRNGSEDYVDQEDFYSAADCHSVEICQHVEAVLAMRSQFDSDLEEGILPKEAFFEIVGLFILPAARAKAVWQGPLNTLIKKKYKPANYSTMVLETVPLEYRHTAETDDLQLIAKRRRREKAMARLYRDVLGVETIEGIDNGLWMGRCE